MLRDEISGLPLSLQARILSAIETRRFRPIGAHHDAISEFRLRMRAFADSRGFAGIRANACKFARRAVPTVM